MTERKSLESERAGLVALADQIEWAQQDQAHDSRVFLGSLTYKDCGLVVTALRRLAAQDQKPVAYQWLHRSQMTGEPVWRPEQFWNGHKSQTHRMLYLSPPPAAGWDILDRLHKSATDKLRDISQLMSNPPQNSAIWDLRNEIKKEFEALHHNAPADTGAGKSEPVGVDILNALADLTDAFLSRHGCFPCDKANDQERHWKRAMERAYELIGQPNTPDREEKLARANAVLRPHGGADAGVRPCPFCGKQPVLLATTESDSFIRCYELRCDNCGIGLSEEYKANTIELWNTRALSKPSPVAANASAEQWATDLPDGSVCFDAYAGWSRDQLKNRCLELIGRIEQLEESANASAEARLREALSQIAKLKADLQAWEITAKRIEEAETEKSYDPATQPFDEPFRHVEHPHASDCDKQGDSSLNELLANIDANYDKGKIPSDCTADVTESELADFIDGRGVLKPAIVARALLDAFTVGRR